MKPTKLQSLSMALGVAGLIVGWVQSMVDGKITEDYVKEEVDRLMEEKEKEKDK